MAKRIGKTKSSRFRKRIKLRKTRKTRSRSKHQRGGQENLMLVFQSNVSSPNITNFYQLNSGHIRDIYQYLNQKLYDTAAPLSALQEKYHRFSHFISQKRIYVYNCNTQDWVRDETYEPIYFHKIKLSDPDEKEIYLSSEPELEGVYTFSADDTYYFYLSLSDPDEHTPVDTFCKRPVSAAAPPPPVSDPNIEMRSYVNYVISSHGRATSKFFSPPHPISLGFFTQDGCILSCPNKLQTSACADKESHSIVEQISPGFLTRDYLLSKDEDTTWKSGAVDCNTREIVFNLEPYHVGSEIPLEYVINKIREHHLRKYPLGIDARVYCLFCRGGGDVVRVECSIGRRK